MAAMERRATSFRDIDTATHETIEREADTMPMVACPSCGERGKIPPTLVGSRIKCKKCGNSFTVAPPPAKAAATAEAGAERAAAMVATSHEGIAVEGLDADAWSTASEQSGLVPIEPRADHAPAEGSEGPSKFVAHEATGFKEYKVLSSRDKIFEGKFDLERLEQALNYYAREGWVVKAMATPHIKAFTEGMKEEIVVLLER
jgi:hypothetical protein